MPTPASVLQPQRRRQTASRPVVSPHRSLFHTTAAAAMASSPASALRVPNAAIFVCDIQEKFRNAIHEFDKV